MDRYDTGTRVSWRWGAYTARGRIASVFENDVTRNVRATQASGQAPTTEAAYMIEQEDGARVLRSHSELSKIASDA